MVLIGVWPLTTNTTGIKTTDFALLVKNSRDEMQMLSLEGDMTDQQLHKRRDQSQIHT